MKTKNDLLWGISLIVIGVATLFISFSSILGFELPDMVKRILGIIELVMLVVLAYTSVKKFGKKK